VFTRALHLPLSRTRSIQSIPPHPISLSFILILNTHLCFGLPSGLFLWLPHQHPICMRLLPIHATHLDHLILFDLIILIILREMKLLTMQFSSSSLHFISLRSKYSQHPVFRHPQSMLLPQFQRPSFTPIQNHRHNYSLYNRIFMFLDSRREDKRFWTEW
jgi:hypothetical protein